MYSFFIPLAIIVPWEEELIIVKTDNLQSEIVKVVFVRDGDAIDDFEARVFLNTLGVLNEENKLEVRNIYAKQDEQEIWNYPFILLEAKKQLEEYFARKREEFTLPLKLNQGTEFQNRTWRALATIPYGTAISYGELAKLVHQDEETAHKYARAVGNACGQNPLPIFLPCHRVIGSRGDLVGFAGGVDLKSKLLNLELFNYRDNID